MLTAKYKKIKNETPVQEVKMIGRLTCTVQLVELLCVSSKISEFVGRLDPEMKICSSKLEISFILYNYI
jgi:hypothetical protein